MECLNNMDEELDRSCNVGVYEEMIVVALKYFHYSETQQGCHCV